ncbi:DNA replication and repair protein RecF [Acidithrix sp. C25]|uniref:DNA replication/repair protein RecF n=1 Tax=Acidithrix sp. C25 TaxID=1671482 RepID=UPI002285B4A2|nr:DNA replication and repair protein RecF [Acidithrix sp. C25]
MTDFRKVRSVTITPSSVGVTAIVGRNGQGKSSIIEALSYAITGRSFRGAPKDSMITKECESSIVRANIFSNQRELLLELSLNRGGSDRLLLNRNVTPRRDVVRAIPLTVFTLSDIEIVSGSPAHRREFIDDSLILMGPRASETVDNYERLLQHRSHILKSLQRGDGSVGYDSLEIFDESLAIEGERLIRMRLSLLSRIEPILNELYADIAGKGEKVLTSYVPSVRTNLMSDLLDSRRDDIRRGITSVGPHRDDIIFRINGLNARYEASQGEQRTLAFSLKMALHELLRSRIGEDPIILLDDVFSELDEERIEKVLKRTKSAQAIVTTSIDHQIDEKVNQKLVIESGSLL